MAIPYGLLLILLRSLNAISYVLMSVLCLRELRSRKTNWGGYAYCALVVTYATLYLKMLAGDAIWTTFGRPLPFLQAIDGVASLLIGPLLMHVFYTNERQYVSARRLWQLLLAFSYACALIGSLGAVAVAAGLVRMLVSVNAVFFAPLAFAVPGTLGVLLVSRRPRNSPLQRNLRRSLLALCVVWVSLVLLWRFNPTPPLALAKDACPLVFIFIVTYYVERFAFFDVLIKKGLLAFFSFSLFAIYFMWVGPYLMRFRLSLIVWALSAWPIALLTPWLYRKLSAWLDRSWLGRRFSPAEASRYFLSGLQGSITDIELTGRAEERLGVIFRSQAKVLLDGSLPPAEKQPAELMLAPILLRGEPIGVIRIEPRAHSPRFLSEDSALLSSLAEAFSFLLENLRLREKRLEHEKRERELVLSASRSELKALRAQVNPHFLFNALNAIAGLIPRDPDRAEQTVEQLAEVFRYTLRGSDREWVRLEEELNAVQAYLDVEQARFRDGLKVRMHCGDEAKNVRIPAMIVHTLVENAIKHGVGAITEPGLVEIAATNSNGVLHIEVRDNGPGFRPAATPGYGLRNIRERLKGHFGAAASLSIGRDEALGMTIVSVEVCPQ